jgi:trehalose 6-phosphate phosphatase
VNVTTFDRTPSVSDDAPDRPPAPGLRHPGPAVLQRQEALFLDFDGTLAELAPRPEQVRVPPALLALLGGLQEALGGALAVVSGRPIEQLDTLLAPLSLPLAGVHGAERRDAAGRRHDAPLADPRLLDELMTAGECFARSHPGVWLERKTGAFALHWRQAPEHGPACIFWMEQALAGVQALQPLAGKSVVEAKPAGRDKGRAVQAFLSEAPFASRRPVFAGDDVTDEAGIVAAQALGGRGLKVGPGPSDACERLADPAAVHDWLAASWGALSRQRPWG